MSCLRVPTYRYAANTEIRIDSSEISKRKTESNGVRAAYVLKYFYRRYNKTGLQDLQQRTHAFS